MSLNKEIERYSQLNGYAIENYHDITCSCGRNEFELYSDDTEGGAFVVCTTCGAEHDIENSRQYIEEITHNISTCDNDSLNAGYGISYYPKSSDPRWIYVGAHCRKCGLSGVYVDWKVN